MASFEELVKHVNKQLPGSFPDWTSRQAQPHPHIPTGIFMLDYLMGIGGVPCKKMTEFYGDNGCGKTTAALETARECQELVITPTEAARFGCRACNKNLCVLYVDAEHDFDPKYAVSLGVDLSPKRFALIQPDSAEQGFNVLDLFLEKCDNLGLGIVDSVAAMTPQAIRDKEFGDTSALGLHARMWAEAMQKLRANVTKSAGGMIFINQTRSLIPVGWQPPGAPKTTTTGGNAMKFYMGMRVEFVKGAALTVQQDNFLSDKAQKVPIGHRVKMTVVKNKCAVPRKSGEALLRYGKGYDSLETVTDIAGRMGLLTMAKNGSCKLVAPFSDPAMPEQSISGKEELSQHFSKHPDQLMALYHAVKNQLEQTDLEVAVDASEAMDVEDGPARLATPEITAEDVNLLSS